MSKDSKEVLLRAGEAAELYGTTPKTLRRILIREKVPVLQLTGRHYLVKKSDIEALKAARFKPISDETQEEQS